MPRRMAFALVLAVVHALPAAAQQRPLETQDPVPIAAGHVRVEVGVDLELDRGFPLSGLEGDLLRVPSLGLGFGLGGVAEFQVDGGFNVLFVEERRPAPLSGDLDFSGDTTTDIEDPVIGTKIRLQRETRRRPAVGVRFAARFPSASNESGIGNDTTDLFVQLLAGKGRGATRVLANFGMGVLGDALEGDRQNDVLTGGLAILHDAGRWTLVGEAHGRVDVQGDAAPGTGDRGEVRLGGRVDLRPGLGLDGGVVVGLSDEDPALGLTIGLSASRKTF